MQKLVIAAAVHHVPKPHVRLDPLRLEYQTTAEQKYVYPDSWV